MATYTDNASTTSYKIDANSTLIRKDLTVGNNTLVRGILDVSGNTTLKNVVASGTLDVSGNTTLKTTSVTGTLTTPAGFSVDVSSNVVVKGTLNQPLFNTTSRMMQVSTASSDDLYEIGATTIISRYARPIVELETDVDIRVFADASNSVVADEFVTKARSMLPPTGKIMYYDNPGTSTYPLDGSAGVPPLYSAIPTIMGTPKFADITDTSAYKYALKKIYSHAPTVTDLSGNTGGGYPQKLAYSTYNDKSFSYDGMKRSLSETGMYYTARGWDLMPPDYVKYDVSGNPADKDYFICNTRGNAPYCALELIYATGANSIPSTVCLQYTRSIISATVPAIVTVPGFPNTVSVGPLQMGCLSQQAVNPSAIPAIKITVTTDPTIHGKNIANGVNTAYYNIGARTLDIVQPVPTVWTSTQSLTGITSAPYTMVHTMSYFSGTFVFLKKSKSSYTLNGYSDVHPFVLAYTNEPDAFILQASPTIIMNNDLTINGSRLSGFPVNWVHKITDDTTINPFGFSGLVLTMGGYYSKGQVTLTVYNSTFNSSASNNNEGTTLAIGDKTVGNNPYSNSYTYLVQAKSSVLEWSNEAFKWSGRRVEYDPWSTTPESMALYDSSYYQYSTPGNIDTAILIHEHGHSKQYGYGIINRTATESEPAASEMDAQRYSDGLFMVWFRTSAVPFTPVHFYGQMRGYFPITKYRGSINLIANPYTLGFTTNSAVQRLGTGISYSAYGENELYIFFKDKYDKTNQIFRRYYELINATATKYLVDKGALWVSSFNGNVNDQISKFCYSQAVYDVTGLRMDGPNGLLTDYYISHCFLRNNTGIPEKYQNPFPWWLSGSTCKAAEELAQDGYKIVVNNQGGSTANNLPAKTINYWTDVDRSIPWGTDRYGFKYVASAGTGTGSAFSSYSWLDGKTLIPYWPRNIAGGDEKEFSLGSWTRDSSGYSGYFNYDASGSTFVYNTSPYLTSKTYYNEDMSSKCFILPVAGGPDLGVTSNNHMQSMSITVHRGNWDFSVVQYVPDASGIGTWNQLPSSGNVTSVDVSGVWVDGSGEVIINRPDSSGVVTTINTSFLDVSGAEQTINFNLSGFTVQQFGGYYYYPKLVCVNRNMYDFGVDKNIYPAVSRYTGKITLNAIFT